MDDKTKKAIESLHVPLNDEDMASIDVPDNSTNEVGEEEWHDGKMKVFPQWLYARRLDEVFKFDWNSKLEEVNFWGRQFWRCTIEVQSPSNQVVRRSGLAYRGQEFRSACEMFGIGGTYGGELLYCTRQLNIMFGFGWNSTIERMDEGHLCRLTVTPLDSAWVNRGASGETEEAAFKSACEMFGINPEESIPF